MNSQDVFEGLDTLMDSFIGGESSYQEISYFINESISGRDIDILDFLHEYIEDGIKNKDGDRIEFCIALSGLLKKDKFLLNVYKQLLCEGWHSRQEDIVDIIDYYGDASAVPVLIKCFDLKYDWLALNSFYSFHRKLMWTIRNVDSKNYKETLRSVSKKVSPKLKAELNQCIGK
jgi:hypothetical protein